MRFRRQQPEMPERMSKRDPGELPVVAAITMTRDSGAMIRRWVDHYGAQLGLEHVYVIDDHSADGSTDDLPCTVLKFPFIGKYSFEPSRMGILSNFARALLFTYDAVLLADADEFVVAEPQRFESLRHFAAAREGSTAIGVLGYNVIHNVGAEEPLDLTAPSLLRQREFARFTPLMCKPALKWVGADWVHASHGIKTEFAIDPDLVMFHLKYADADELAVMAERRHHAAAVEGRAVKSGWGRPADEMSEALQAAVAQLTEENLVPFKPGPRKIAAIVRHEEDKWRAAGAGQHLALAQPPYTRIPDRFRDLV